MDLPVEQQDDLSQVHTGVGIALREFKFIEQLLHYTAVVLDYKNGSLANGS